MLAIKAPLVDSPHARPVPSPTTSALARRVFEVLRDLHQLAETDAVLLARAIAGLRLIRSAGTYSSAEHDLFAAALCDLDASDAWVVETAACWAADCVVSTPGRAHRADHHRALWLAAISRLAEAVCSGRTPAGPRDVCALWTAETLYLEFDGDGHVEALLDYARTRVAALEALTQRRAVLASSAARRGVA